MNKLTSSRQWPYIKLLVIVMIFALLLWWISGLFMPFFNQLPNPDFQQALRLWTDSMGWLGWLFVLAIQIIQIVIAFIPGEPVEILAGMLYGSWGGLFICLIGIAAASSAIFFTVRKFGNRLLYHIFGKDKLQKFQFLNDTDKIEAVTFILFLLPGTPKDLLTYVAGITKINPTHFLFISTFARIPSVITSTLMGSTMGDGNWKMMVVVFILTAGIGLFGILYKDKILKQLHLHKKPKSHL